MRMGVHIPVTRFQRNRENPTFFYFFVDNGWRVCENKTKSNFPRAGAPVFKYIAFAYGVFHADRGSFTNMNQELVDYIKQQRNISVSKNKIINVLLEQGWHQSEIDEAFAAADGDGGMAKNNGSGEGKFADFEPTEGSGGGNRKMIIYAICGVAVLAILAVAVIFVSIGGKKDTVDVPNNAVNNNAAATDNAADDSQKKAEDLAQAQVDAAMVSAINKLEASIQPPAGWTVREGMVRERPLAVFFKPTVEKNSSGKSVFNENISISQDVFKSVNVADAAGYIAKAKSTIESTVKGYKIVSEKKVKLSDGTEATLITGTYTQNELALKNTQLYAFKGDNVYVVTGIVLESNWAKEKDMIGTSILSFKFPAGE